MSAPAWLRKTISRARIATLRSEMRDLERRLTIRMGAMFGGGVTVLLTALGIITAIILTA